MQPTILNVVISGASVAELIKNGRNALAVLEGGKTTTAKAGKRAPAAAVDEEDQLEMSSDDEDVEIETASDDVDTDMFGTDDDEEEIVEQPAKTAKKNKGNGASKLTASDINEACKTHAKKNGRDKTLAVLKKFKVKSVTELSADQYPQVLKALTGK